MANNDSSASGWSYIGLTSPRRILWGTVGDDGSVAWVEVLPRWWARRWVRALLLKFFNVIPSWAFRKRRVAGP